MTDDIDLDAILERNKGYMAAFDEDLIASGLSDKTTNEHYSNASLYISYVMNYEGLDATSGTAEYILNGFLGDYFIRKCMWSTPKTIKTTAASLKKFYRSMLQHGYISKGGYDELTYAIKDNMLEWQATCEIYDDPNEPNPFIWF